MNEDLFVKPDCNIVNELDGYSEPTLFDFLIIIIYGLVHFLVDSSVKLVSYGF